MKKCNKCGVFRPRTLDYFSKSQSNKDGLRGDCRECERAGRTERRRANPESSREYSREYRKRNPKKCLAATKKWMDDHPGKSREYYKRSYEKGKVSINEKVKIYRLKHPEENKTRQEKYRITHQKERSEYNQRWYLLNKRKCRIKGQRRRSLEKELPSTLTLEQWESIIAEFYHKCAYCGKEGKLAQDHFLAISKGGEYSHNNIIPSCKRCNSSKGAKDFYSWYPLTSYYSKARERKIIKYLGYKNGIQQLTFA